MNSLAEQIHISYNPFMSTKTSTLRNLFSKGFLNTLLIKLTGHQISDAEPYDAMARRAFINDFVVTSKPRGKILDLGGGPGSFAKKKYPHVFTHDQHPGNVDFVGDIHSLSRVVPHDFDTVICTEVFEHTEDPRAALREIYTVLKPGGLFIATAPLTHELHGEDYGDYWRITPQGWKLLLTQFTDIHIQTRGKHPHINHVGVRAKKA